MLHYQKFVIFLILFETAAFILYAQNTDSISQDKTNEPLNIFRIDTATQIENNPKDIVKLSPDTVYLKNGDKITGRIISLEQGRLKIDAQGPGVVYLKWHKIATINGGLRIYKVEDIYGSVFIGLIRHSVDTGKILVVEQDSFEVRLAVIVRLFPIEAEWYRGFKGSMGAGISYAKSSDVLTANAEYNLYYIISKWKFRNNLSYISTTEDSEASSLRVQTAFQALYALPRKWVVSEINSFNRNDELGIKSRISFGLGMGNYLVQTDRQSLLIISGIAQNSEKSIESDKYVSNFEWPVSIQHTVYSFARPDLTASTYLAAFIGLTEQGRYRFDGNADLSWEFIKNLKLQLTIYYNYDNKVVEGKITEQDYGTVLSLIVDLK